MDTDVLQYQAVRVDAGRFDAPVEASLARDASRKDPTFGSWLPHVRIRPSSTSGEGALGGFEVELEPNRIDIR